MKGTAPSVAASRAMKKFYPQWAAENMSVPPIPASQDFPHRAEDIGFVEFVLSSNWILRPEGLQELYTKIREHIPAPDITYESYLGCFRVRCQVGDEEQVVTRINHFMDEIVRAELAKVPKTGMVGLCKGNDSNKIRHISEWRLAHIDEKEQEAYELYSYPQQIVVMPFRGTWRVPKEADDRGMTIQKLFASLDPVATLAASTHCTVVKGSNGVSLHFGANSEHNITRAKRKMDNILKYYDLPFCVGSTQGNILHAEGDEGVTELRYLSHINRHFVATVLLDSRELEKVAQGYCKIFEQGSCARLVLYDQPVDTNKPIPSVTVSPAISQDQACMPFQEFHNWKFEAKESDTTQNILGDPHQLVGLASDNLKQVNPEAAPHVLKWTKSLPPFGENFCGKLNDEIGFPNLSDSSANGPLPSSTSQSTQTIGGFAHYLSGHALGQSFIEEWNSSEKEDISTPRVGGNQGNTINPSHCEAPGRQTTQAEQHHHQTEDMTHWGRINRAQLYQYGSSMTPSPATTNASSQVVRNNNQVLQPSYRQCSPSAIKKTTPNSRDQLSQMNNAAGTNLSAPRSNSELLKMAFSDLLVGSRPDMSNATGLQQSGAVEAVYSSIQRENTFTDNPFVSEGGLGSTSVIIRHSANGHTESKQFSSEKESRDLLSSSPEKPQLAMAPLVPTPRIASSEQSSSQFHSTMNQQPSSRTERQIRPGSEQRPNQFPSIMNAEAGSRPARHKSPQSGLTSSFEQGHLTVPPHTNEIPDSLTMMKVHDYMSMILEPLRLFQGSVTLKAEIGRFIFTKIHWKHISTPDDSRCKEKSIEDMEQYLKRHSNDRDLLFTKILSLSGGDANHMANLSHTGTSSSKMWQCAKREVFYEFWCLTKGGSGKGRHFIFNINADDFSYNLRPRDTKISRVSVHCVKRLFDFRLVVESAHDIEENCGNFAREVIGSLKVQPQMDGPPIISFTNHQDWGVQTKSVRIRHIATYGCTMRDCALEITQVQKMKIRSVGKGNHWHFEYVPDMSGKPQDGVFPLWFEASIRSNTADSAFAENLELGFADEASWTPEGLKSSGAFHDLVQSATDVVKHMDGIGYWCNNQQDSMKYREPPRSEADAVRRGQERKAKSYW